MRKLLAELDRVDKGHGRRPRSAASAPGDRARRITAAALAVVLAMTVAGLFAYKQWGLTLSRDGFRMAAPLGHPPQVVTGVGSFAYMNTQDAPDQPVAYNPCRPVEYVTGMVALDAPQLSRVMTRPSGPAEVRAIVLHELGHLVGLDHVDDPGELMYSENVGRLDLGPGDREGLAALGSGRCFH